jgi:hypothetical protein
MSLDRLLGTWELTMRHHAMSDPVSGRQHYERVLDGAYVRLDWSYDHPDFPDAVAMLSEDAMHYFDVRGVTRVFDLEITDDGWTMVRLDPEFAQRYTTRFVGPDAMESEGEFSTDDGTTWEHDFSMSYARVE